MFNLLKTCSKCGEQKHKELFGKWNICIECDKKRIKLWRNINKQPKFMGPPLPKEIAAQRIKQTKKEWREKNKEKEKISKQKWEMKNKDLIYAKCRKRQAAKLNSIPKWANEFFIKEIYSLAALRTKMVGIKFHVDHIIPLQSKIVCGLHCESNLQIISEKQNKSKSNKFWPDMP